MLDYPDLQIAQRWDAEERFLPVAVSPAAILVLDGADGVGGDLVNYLKSFNSHLQLKLYGNLYKHSAFAANGTLVFSSKERKWPFDNYLQAVLDGRVLKLRNEGGCNCLWDLAAASATSRVAVVVEAIHTSFSFDPDTSSTVKSVDVVDLGPPITFQELRVQDGGKIKNLSHVALSPDGLHLAMLSGGELRMYTLPPVGSGKPVQPIKAE